jgi:hypothetical protein
MFKDGYSDLAVSILLFTFTGENFESMLMLIFRNYQTMCINYSEIELCSLIRGAGRREKE